MNTDQKECIIQVKFGLLQLVSMEPEVFLPSTIIGHVTQYCNHVVSSPDKNNNIKKVSESESEYFTGDTSIDIHSPGPTIAKTLDLTSDVNLATRSSELSAEKIIAAGIAFQS